MDAPERVQAALDGESVAVTVPLGGDDALYVTPTRTLVYRSQGLLSDESVEEFPHDAERVAVSEGRRKATVTLDYGLDGEREFAVPVDELDDALHSVLAGVLNAASVTEPGETVRRTFRFKELTLVVAGDRVVKHIGAATWDSDYEQVAFADVTGLAVEEGSVASQLVVETSGRTQRIKVPSSETREVHEAVEAALLDHYDVASYAAFERLAAEEADDGDDADGGSEADEVDETVATAGTADGASGVSFADDDLEPVDAGGTSPDAGTTPGGTADPTTDADRTAAGSDARAGGSTDTGDGTDAGDGGDAVRSAAAGERDADTAGATAVAGEAEPDAGEPATRTPDGEAASGDDAAGAGDESPAGGDEPSAGTDEPSAGGDAEGGFADSPFESADVAATDDVEARLEAMAAAIRRQEEALAEQRAALEDLADALSRDR